MKKLSLFMSTLVVVIVMTACTDKNPVLTVEGGQIQGVKVEKTGVFVYRGVPYAAPPVGVLRWREPQPVVPWQGVKQADRFGNACMQGAHQKGDFYTKEFFDEGDAPYSEDCLYLNVWTSAPGEKDRKLPVAMWVHGGGFSAGWGFEKEMDGEAWAERNVVLVTINYRLGIFGFLAHPELSAESIHNSSGNYGILDQIAALKWIKNNITEFGGDPDNILIFGQSAGAMSVQKLVASPLAKSMVAKAVIMSGGGISDNPMLTGPTLGTAEQIGKELMDWSGYNTLEKMRTASAEELNAIVGKYSQATKKWVMLSPNIDGYVNEESFSDAVRENKVADVPYMIGSVRDDIPLLAAEEEIENFCFERKKSNKKCFAYQFARPLPGDDAGAYHSSELWYIFNTLDKAWRPFTQGDKDLSKVMIDCWTNFAKDGDPSGTKQGWWKPFSMQNQDYMIFRLNAEGDEASEMGQPIPSPKPMNFGMQ